ERSGQRRPKGRRGRRQAFRQDDPGRPGRDDEALSSARQGIRFPNQQENQPRHADVGPEGLRTMGQKVNPVGFRIGITRTWDSRWFAKRDYAKLLHEDIQLRRYLKEKLYGAGISRIDIERAASKVKINVHTAR